ncbi:glutathione s-transferase omega-1 [Plakobranchus ocellatus]|uniref:Glutathione S-transferase omega n=1 Tax=Plakobranchus ocellatus TaxID=259542 RepID=A0AAV3YUL5_9GAST|nr:glutathione s-transferase omega-1 [Plakobranchus ocellatus]
MASSDVPSQSSDELRKPDDPLLPGQVLRIYSMRMCPYAQRTRLIARAKGVSHDIVNLDLNNKPDWFFDLNPYGEVPVVIHNGGHVYESLIAAEYLEEAFPEPKLFSDDPLIKAYERIYYNHWTKKGIPAFYSLLKAGYPDPEQTQRLNQHISALEGFMTTLDKPYFHGAAPGFSDYMIWPWFERLPMLKDITEFSLSSKDCPRLLAWIDRMWKDPVVQHCKIDPELLTKHYTIYRKGRPDFTIGADGKATGSDSQESVVVPEALENLDGLREAHTRDRRN